MITFIYYYFLVSWSSLRWLLGFLLVSWVRYGGISLPEKGPLEQQVFLGGYVFCLAGYTWDGPVGASSGTDNHPPSLFDEGGRLSVSGFGVG